MSEIIESKGWNWKIVADKYAEMWKNPSVISYYLLNRWKTKNKKHFLDLGCGLGRHTILFAKNAFDVEALDISENAIERAKKWAKDENLSVKFAIGDMIDLPYDNNSFDCILCRNVMSHTNTAGIKKIISEIKRILKTDGECYLTLSSKNTWGYQQDWPKVDENTKLLMVEGPEHKVPHFYADYDLIKELFADFKIEFIYHIADYYDIEGKVYESWHYHVLIKKI